MKNIKKKKKMEFSKNKKFLSLIYNKKKLPIKYNDSIKSKKKPMKKFQSIIGNNPRKIDDYNRE